MTLRITISQVAKSTTPAGQAREDLDLATLVTLTATGGTGTYAWTLLDAPTNVAGTAASAAVLSALTGTSVTITPDNRGTYFVECHSGVEVTRITFYAGPSLSATAAAVEQLTLRLPEDLSIGIEDLRVRFQKRAGNVEVKKSALVLRMLRFALKNYRKMLQDEEL